MIDALTASPLAWAAARALVAFVWQGAIVGGVIAIALVLLRRQSANARYLLACAGLLVLCATPVVTGFHYFDSDARGTVQARLTQHVSEQGGDVSAGAGAQAQTSTRPAAGVKIANAVAWLNTQLPVVLLVWATGVFALALRLGRGWVNVARTRRLAQPIDQIGITLGAARIARLMGIRQSFQLLSSVRVSVPSVVGWLKPAILLPASVIAGLPASHLEAILAHELAHIRRSDFFVNVLQCSAEVLLFYQPAVWWVSRQIRIERELCADDLAVAVSGDRVAYASALASLESMRAETIAIAMVSGDDLLSRVRRIIEPDAALRPRISGGFAMTVAMMLLLFALTAAPASTSSIPPEVALENAAARMAAPLPAPIATAARKPFSSTVTAHTPAERPALSNAVSQGPAQGQVSGVVRDSQGGVLPGVTLTIRNVAQTADPANSVALQRVTNAAGRFTFAGLTPGDYELTASLRGFRTNRTRLTIAQGASQSVIIGLELGSLSETVTVQSNTASTAPSSRRTETPASYFDLAKSYYEQGRLVEAEEMTMRAIALMRSETPAATTTAQLATPSGPIRVGGDIREPRKIRDVKPVYPAIASAAALEGIVIIEATIARDGTVSSARVLRNIPLLDAAALEAVRQWQYTPTLLNGVPVEVLMTVTVTFMR